MTRSPSQPLNIESIYYYDAMRCIRTPEVKELMVKVCLTPGAFPPAYQTDGAAGMDLASLAEITLQPNERRVVPTGISMAIPSGYEGQVRGRSSLNKKGIIAAHGTIDSDYTGDIGVILHNQSNAPYYIHPGDRIAQLVIAPVLRVRFELVSELPKTSRGENGFGSTGK